MCDKTAILLRSGDGLEMVCVSLTAEHKHQVAQISRGGAEEGKRVSGMEMTDDKARVEGRGEKMCEGRERLWRGSERLGVKREE